jgi:hypothetical protein
VTGAGLIFLACIVWHYADKAIEAYDRRTEVLRGME